MVNQRGFFVLSEEVVFGRSRQGGVKGRGGASLEAVGLCVQRITQGSCCCCCVAGVAVCDTAEIVHTTHTPSHTQASTNTHMYTLRRPRRTPCIPGQCGLHTPPLATHTITPTPPTQPLAGHHHRGVRQGRAGQSGSNTTVPELWGGGGDGAGGVFSTGRWGTGNNGVGAGGGVVVLWWRRHQTAPAAPPHPGTGPAPQGNIINKIQTVAMSPNNIYTAWHPAPPQVCGGAPPCHPSLWRQRQLRRGGCHHNGHPRKVEGVERGRAGQQ